MHELLKDDLTGVGCTPHCLIELSKRESHNMQTSTITVPRTNTSTKGILSYKGVDYDVNDDICTLGQYILSTTDKKESIKHHGNSHVLDSSFNQGQCDKSLAPYEPSGQVIIYMGKLDTVTHKDETDWNFTYFETLKRCKSNILGSKNNTHFGSRCYYSSFGNRGRYHISNDYSVITYCTIRYKNISIQFISDENTIIMDNACASILKNTIENLSKLVRNLTLLVSLILGATY